VKFSVGFVLSNFTCNLTSFEGFISSDIMFGLFRASIASQDAESAPGFGKRPKESPGELLLSDAFPLKYLITFDQIFWSSEESPQADS
jgi:hypothetical protein